MKNFLLLITLIIFVISCEGKPTSESINTLPPTLVPTTANNTTKPTSISFPPTLTPPPTLSNVDFVFPTAFSPFSNQFPLSIIPQTKGYLFHCAFDADQIEYKSVRIENMEIRKWVKCYFSTSNHKTDYVTVPLYVINWDNLTWFSTFAAETTDLPRKNPDQCSSNTTCGYAEIIPEEKPIAIRFEWTDLPHKYILGLGFGNQPTDGDPSQKFFRPLINEGSQEYFDKFASTGDTDNLPRFDYLEHFLLAYDYFPEFSK